MKILSCQICSNVKDFKSEYNLLMKLAPYAIRAKVWLYQGDSPWHFITISKSFSKEIKKEYLWPRNGFGSIPVYVKIGKTEWKTSIFPEKKGTYVLPLKKEIRIKEKIIVGDTIDISLELIV